MQLTEPVGFALPKKPRVKQKEAPPDARKVAIIPIRACTDPSLTLGMIRVLLCICSYANRAGITWVGQQRLAQDLKISRQAVQKQLAKLAKAGYLVIVAKGWRGERANTLRVIFDPSIDTDTAISVTSAQEDTRPPSIKEQQMKDDQVDPEGLKRIAQIMRSAIKPVKPTKEFTMPKDGQTITTKRMHAEIEQAKKRRSKPTHTQPPEVAHEDSQKVADQPVDNPSICNPQRLPNVQLPEVARTNKEQSIKSIKDTCLSNQMRIELKKSGLTDEQIDSNLDALLDAYRTEGLTPNPDRLVAEILQLSRDA